jgi:predicted alpha/beta-hydrolase family hydrolase
MQGWRERLQTLGEVVPLDYPYQAAGRRYPDKLPVLVRAHRDALAAARALYQGPVILAGKSMGGRIGCHVSLEEHVDGLVCFGYPLRGARRQGPLRDQVLVAVRAPVLFVQGTRDDLCPLDLFAETRARMGADTALHVVDGGDHSLAVRKTDLRRRGESQDDVDRQILQAVAGFLANNTEPGTPSGDGPRHEVVPR